MPHSVVFVCLFYMPMCISAYVSSVFQFHNLSILSAWSFQMVQLQIAIFCSWFSIRNSFQPWYYRPSKRMSSHAAITRSTHFMNRMKDRESVGLLHFVSVHTVFGCGCSCCRCCTSIQMAAIWAQSHFNHLPTFFLSFFYLFIFCVCTFCRTLGHAHTHRTLILKHVVMLFLPARFVFMFMLVIKRFQTWAEWSEWEGARGRESEKKQYLKPDFFLTNLLSLGLLWNVYVYSGHTYTYTHTSVWENAFTFVFVSNNEKL